MGALIPIFRFYILRDSENGVRSLIGVTMLKYYTRLVSNKKEKVLFYEYFLNLYFTFSYP